MSVTFTTSMSEITAWGITCGIHDNGMTEHRFGTWADAQAFLQSELDVHGCTGHLAVCGDEFCASTRMTTDPIENDPAPEINVSNTNAAYLLDLLGVKRECGELVGSLDPKFFLGRVMIAQAVSPSDAGLPATATVSRGGTTVIDCGRAPGYADDRLESLRELAEFAVSRDRQVQWA